MKIITTDQIKKIDRATVENEGITSLQLIERVAESVAAEVVSLLSAQSRIAIFAGPGNNGADALATARILYQQGLQPEVFLFNIGGDKLNAECRICRDLLLEAAPDAIFTEVIKQFNRPHLSPNHIVIDGLFGTGLREALSGGFRELVKYIDDSRAFVISIDIPSGLFGDWNPNAIHRNMMHADLTLAVQFPHLSFFMAENDEVVGRWKVMDIGLSSSEIRKTTAPFYLVERNDVRRLLRQRPDFCSKDDFGSALLVAGSYGMMGAAVLAARGALRAGVGKVTVYSPRCGYEILQSSTPEAMFVASNSEIHISSIRLPHSYSTVGIGPGIGTADATVDALEQFLTGRNEPVIIDADALNCIAKRQSLLHRLPPQSVLTPHAGEFDRIFGQQPNSEARLVKAIEMARYHNVLIVLKGRYTTIVRPDGRLYFNSSGNPAMATPGSGDVLTGVITALMAQGYRPEVAALCGVYIHGVAGDLAAETQGQYGVTAGDIAANIGRAFKLTLNV
ncbi:MAG: NAD(P)H-hydrate dehydratase [Muribaculaceae bacterium]|nr:NAD(P)H-hydrate dehydratase [Muribaculaceae bacterium]